MVGSAAYNTLPPAAETPLSQQGHSLQPIEVTVDDGLITNVSLLDRPQTAARILDNMQQIIPGIWTSVGLGWTPQRTSVFNSGAPWLAFSFFVDNSGNKTLLFQVGSVLYSYNLATNTETAILTGLNATAIPTIRRSYSQLTAQSVAVYCNGVAQPQKITSITASTALQFNQIFPNLSPSGLAIANEGTAGTTQYAYSIQTVYSNGTTSLLTAGVSTYTGNATLNGTNYNQIQWIPVPNAVSYNIYRTIAGGTPSTVGLIASAVAGTLTTNTLGNQVLSYNDTGLTASGLASGTPAITGITNSAGLYYAMAYQIVAVFPNGAQTVSGSYTTTTSNPSLNNVGANNTVSWTGVAGASSYQIYRVYPTLTYNAQGLSIPNSTGLLNIVGSGTTSFTDIGYIGDGTTPQYISPININVQGAWGATGPYFGNFNVTNNSGKTYNTPKFCEPLGTRMIYGGFPGTSTAFDILISDANNIEQFSVHSPGLATDSVAFTYPAQLGSLTGLKTIRLSNQTNQTVTIGGCTDGIFMITGSDATSYAMFTLTEEIGILSNRTWIQIANDVYFLSTVGIRNFSSLANNAILTPDEVSKNIHDQFANVDTTNAYKAFAVHYPATQEIQFWYPQLTDSGLCSHAFIANYNAIGNSVNGNVAGIKWSTRSGTIVNAGIVFNGVMYGGGNDGTLQVHYSGNNYNTTPMIFQLATSLITMPFPLQKFSNKDITVITEGDAQYFPITPYVNRKMSDESWQRYPAFPQNQIVNAGNPPQTILGSWALGYSAFPGRVNKLLSSQFQGNGNFWDVEITSSSGQNTLDFQALLFTMSGGGLER
jgi:hypothetical protein